MHAGGALGQGENSSATVVQPGMELMPTTAFGGHGAGVGVGGVGGGGALGSMIGGGQNLKELHETLQGAPPDVLAAAQRLSLIPMTVDPTVIRTAPGAESTDTGMLSVSLTLFRSGSSPCSAWAAGV